jgi:hypothetical protein
VPGHIAINGNPHPFPAMIGDSPSLCQVKHFIYIALLAIAECDIVPSLFSSFALVLAAHRTINSTVILGRDRIHLPCHLRRLRRRLGHVPSLRGEGL